MSKIKYLLIICFISISFSQECINKDEYIQYSYINGITVRLVEMESSILKIQSSLGLKMNIFPLYNPTNYQGEIKLSDLNSIKNFSISALNDIKEVTKQKDYEFTSLVTDKNSHKNKPVNDSLIESLKSQLSKNANIVFAHSQGNLVANDICKKMDDRGKFEIISIASPGNYLPCNSKQTYALYDHDTVINGLRLLKYRESTFNDANLEVINGNFINHELADYLNDKRVVEILFNGIKEDKIIIYNKYLNFPVFEAHISKGELLKSRKDSKEIAKIDLANHNAFVSKFQNMRTIASSLIVKMTLGQVNKAVFYKTLEIPFDVQSDDELVELLKSFNSKISQVCSQIPITDYSQLCKLLNSKLQNRSMSSIESKNPIINYRDEKNPSLKLMCKDVNIGKFNFQIESMDSRYNYNLSFNKESRTISNKDSVWAFEIIANKDNVISIQNIDSIGASYIKPVNYEYCNNFKKLNEVKCMDYLKTIL